MTTSGVLENAAYRLGTKQRIQTPSIVVRRRSYEELGGFNERLAWTEDWEMWVRIASRYPVWYEPEPLAVYRVRSGSNTSRMVLTGENIRDALNCIDIFKEYFPPEVRPDLVARARREWAHFAIESARQLTTTNQKRAAMVQLREALRCSRSRLVLEGITRVFVPKILLAPFRREEK
jgi:hypothetical protein